MALTRAFIPYGVYWSSPFCRWQGSIGNENSVVLAANTTSAFLDRSGISPESFDAVTLGMTVPQHHSFYGAPWLAGMIGAAGVTGATYAQACATSARIVASAAAEVELGASQCTLGVTCDRTSNGPHIVYPNPAGIGGKVDSEEWVWDNFNKDPFAGNAMIQTAENVAAEAGISREEQDQVTLRRHEQYQAALADDRAFQRRYMMPLTVGRGKKAKEVVSDEGVFPTTAEGLAKLGPVLENGSVTFGVQTYPADGNAGIVIATEQRAKELAKDSAPSIQVLGFGSARVKKSHMPMAVVPAAQSALQFADVGLKDVKAIKTHNPFAVNDIYFANEMGLHVNDMNNFGSPLIYGHPQGPTGLRVIIELIEELVQSGGGIGLFAGCAAGDTSMAVVLKVG